MHMQTNKHIENLILLTEKLQSKLFLSVKF